MSQNKTVIQGLEPADSQSGGSMGNSGFYSRGSRPAAHGTVVPGMMETQAAPAAGNQGAAAPQPRKPMVQPGKPIVGFLYSISRTPAGEFWPLQIGRNTIGQNPASNVLLAEGTVSTDHAVIVVRQIKSTGNVIAAITDTQSTNGTMINGDTIGFTAVECHNGDIITIGNNYELLLVLVDAGQLGLSVSKNFIPVAVEEEEEQDDMPDFLNGNTRPGGFDPYNDGGPGTWGNNGGYSPAGGTVGLDGSVSGNNHGGTVSM